VASLRGFSARRYFEASPGAAAAADQVLGGRPGRELRQDRPRPQPPRGPGDRPRHPGGGALPSGHRRRVGRRAPAPTGRSARGLTGAARSDSIFPR
jgi:hypothetical protein